MNTGIQDAVDLAGRLAGGTEDGYEAARRPVAAEVVAMTDRMTRAATVDGSVARAVRNTLLTVVGHNPTIRRKLIAVPARIASSARHGTLHLPTAWPWETAWTELFTRVCGPPAPATT